MNLIDQYLGRTIDLLAFVGVRNGKEALLLQDLALPRQGGEICTGVQKLAQRFLLELLTPVGSLTYLPERGTGFLPQVLRGELRTPTAVMAALSEALTDIRKNLRNEELGSEPADEQYLNAVVDSVAVLPGTVNIYITVNSRAGTSREVILPLGTILGGGP